MSRTAAPAGESLSRLLLDELADPELADELARLLSRPLSRLLSTEMRNERERRGRLRDHR